MSIEEKIYEIMKENKLYGDVSVNKNVAEIEISGDWKHEHLRLKFLMLENFDIQEHNEVVIEEDGSDYYTSIHYFKFKEN